MKRLLSAFLILAFSSVLQAQQAIKLSIHGVSEAVSAKLQENGDRLSWFSLLGSSELASNVRVELRNSDQKSGDRGRAAVKADRNAQGKYDFKVDVEVNLRRVDPAKPIDYEVVIETILGNEVFAKGTQDFAAFSKPLVLDGYMWRASNEKMMPEKKLCLAFAAFIENTELRTKYTEKEGQLKFERDDFELFLKQEAAAEWKKFDQPLQGALNNGNALALTSSLPSWVNTSLPLFVRFSVKTPLGNAIWGEYTVNPHEYRKEHRAQHYTAKPFNPAEPPVFSQGTPEPLPPTDNTKEYQGIIASADQLFKEGKFKEAGEKYTQASTLKPNEAYPKKQKEICESKLMPPSRSGTNPPKREGTK